MTEAIINAISSRNNEEAIGLITADAQQIFTERDTFNALLEASIQADNLELVNHLLTHAEYTDAANVRELEIQPIHEACIQGQLSALVYLLSKGVDKDDTQNKYGSSPLIYASMRGHTHIVKALLGAGAKFTTQNNYGITALILAAQNGYTEIRASPPGRRGGCQN